MKIVIAGAGSVGRHLAKLMARENIDIVIMDKKPEHFMDLGENYDLMTMEGSPTSIHDLENAGIKNADLFVAVTPSESANTTSCIFANRLGAKKTLARIDNYEYLLPKNKEIFEKIGVNYLIYPEVLASEEIIQSLKTSWLRQHMYFCNGALELLAIKIRSNAVILNKKFSTGFFNHEKYRIVAIKRKNRTIIPKGEDWVLANDIVYVIASPQNIEFVRQNFGKEDYPIKNIMILGGSRIAQKTAQSLPKSVNVKIIERDKEKSHLLAEKLENTLVINADGRDVEVLVEEGIKEMDAVVAVTENSEENILSCLIAKRFGIRKTIAEVENIDYITLAESMDIGTVINKKTITASYIYQLMLDADVLNVKNLTLVNAEVVEFVAKEGSKITKKPIKNLNLPDNVNLGGIIRNGVGGVVFGNTQIAPNDHVIVFCAAASIRKLESFFN
ncbi:MAG: Trk system potassium transporter TrkA [Prevotellaceae bacterium]|jgi:trk system potassium uptake protein TrkA|nr:Trk system potassium transporter TrkA [Prevotellaceae bacterium]